jgi:hypothetical protein
MDLPLSRELFWDTPIEGIDPERHAGFIVERVLQRGRWEDWELVRKRYGFERLRELVKGLRDLDPRTQAFCRVVLRLRDEDFRCSTPRYWHQGP